MVVFFFGQRDPNFSDDTVWAHDKFDEHVANVAADAEAGEEEGSNKANLASRMNAIRRSLNKSDGGAADGAAKVRLENLDFGVTEEELKVSRRYYATTRFLRAVLGALQRQRRCPVR